MGCHGGQPGSLLRPDRLPLETKVESPSRECFFPAATGKATSSLQQVFCESQLHVKHLAEYLQCLSVRMKVFIVCLQILHLSKHHWQVKTRVKSFFRVSDAYTEAHTLAASSTAFPSPPAGGWVGNAAAQTGTGVHGVFQLLKQQLNLLLRPCWPTHNFNNEKHTHAHPHA